MYPGKDYIGVGCGAVILNDKNEVLLMKRGKKSKNAVGYWTIPGGTVEFFETSENALIREVKEELGISIKIVSFLTACDFILKEEKQHWISTIFLGKIISGTPINCEPEKCDNIQWFSLDTLPEKLTHPTQCAINALYKQKLIEQTLH